MNAADYDRACEWLRCATRWDRLPPEQIALIERGYKQAAFCTGHNILGYEWYVDRVDDLKTLDDGEELSIIEPTPEQIALYRIWQHSRHVVVALGASWNETFQHANAIDALAYEALGDAFERVRDYVSTLPDQ
jgi:hypothetical protein